LDIGESRFHKLRGDWLQEAVRLLEPGQPGRPAKPAPSVEAQQVCSARSTSCKASCAASESASSWHEPCRTSYAARRKKKTPRRKATRQRKTRLGRRHGRRARV
jgi:hypothetical protein